MNYVRDEQFYPHFKAINDLLIEADLDVRIEGHFFVEHGRYYIDGVRLVRRDGSAYSFGHEEFDPFDVGPCMGCNGPDEHNFVTEKNCFECEIKLPGLPCLDDSCNCYAVGEHANIAYGDFLKQVDGEWVRCGWKDYEAVFAGLTGGRPTLHINDGILVL